MTLLHALEAIESQIHHATSAEAENIITNRKPFGRFWTRCENQQGRVYVGIENLYGDAWTEDFRSKKACMDWLTN